MSSWDREKVNAAARELVHGRFDQAFPILTEAEIARVRRFGSLVRFSDGEALFEEGKPRPGMYVLLSGHLAVTTRDGLGRVTPLVDQGPGQYIAEIGTLADDAISHADGHAEGDVEALLITPRNLRALIVEEAELGERIMRALILRRVALIELGHGGPLVIGATGSRDVSRLEEFLRRNGQPHSLLDPGSDTTALDVVTRLAPPPSDLPLVVCPNGEILRNPTEAQVARSLGILRKQFARAEYDVAIVGCGPAGLSTAVYAASEGLSVVVLETHAFGGQAGASARIENYLGFPTGISGQALMGRAFSQARKFGAEVVIPVEVKALDCAREDGFYGLILSDGRRVRTRSVVIASGARYRRPAVENFTDFEGRGVGFWASAFEAKRCAGQEVIVIGGGNSAGQGAVFLAGQGAQVRMMVRGRELAATMSSYLEERISATPNIELMTETRVVAFEGTPEGGLERVRWRTRDEPEQTSPIRDVFVFIGADPATEWLIGCGVELDAKGFVVTGAGGCPLGTNLRGVFAVGDVRAGSVKRVGAAIGEGANVVALIHEYLRARVQAPVTQPREHVLEPAPALS